MPRWGASSETGRLTEVMLSAPAHLSMMPCNEVTRASLAQGLSVDLTIASRQHALFVTALKNAGVRCHFVPACAALPDLSFMRDATLMSPWGLIELRPAVSHRLAETRHVAAAAQRLGVPICGRIEAGTVEGGDVCLLQERVVVIGRSEDRTDAAGANRLAAFFEERGWEAVHTRFDATFLHLDTILTMIAADRAVACVEALETSLLDRLDRLGITIIPASLDDVARLHANLLSLGGRRVVAPAGCGALGASMRAHGIEVIEVDLDQFTRCGGGPHCLTLPLARLGCLFGPYCESEGR